MIMKAKPSTKKHAKARLRLRKYDQEKKKKKHINWFRKMKYVIIAKTCSRTSSHLQNMHVFQ